MSNFSILGTGSSYSNTVVGQNATYEYNAYPNEIFDYNNLFEINYYDVIKHGTQSYNYEGFTYSIPERTLSVGEFGVILNTQESKSNIIKNKYKVNLRSIDQTSKFYWICGDENTLLRVRKHDFFIDRILLENISTTLPHIIKTNLSSVSFFNDLVGVVVGELNTIFYTKNGGYTWERLEIEDFSDYNYNKALYSTNSNFYVAGDNGVLLEFVNSIAGWTAYKRRVYQIEDAVDEYLLVENINDLYKTTISTWNVGYNYYTQSIPTDKELLFLVTNNSKVIAHDINNSFTQIGTDFIYFDFGQEYSDIRNITQRKGTNTFYFTGTDPVSGNDGIFSFDISNFSILGTGSSYSNTVVGQNAIYEYNAYPNEIFDYNGSELLMCGNNSLLGVSTYSTLNFNSLDSTFEDKLKSKLLVIDYDIASKLNFFTDAGEYRLPNSVTFSNVTLNTINSKIGFKPIQHNQTSTNNGTYSETNWITYWTDSQKTFEYYSLTPMDESTKVLISTTFSYETTNGTSISYNNSQVTASASLISLLAPTITMSDTVKSVSIKNSGTGYTTSTNVTTTGGSGTGLVVNITASGGAITNVSIAVSGTGYNIGDVITISGGTSGSIKVDTIDSSSKSRYDGYGSPAISAVPTSGVAGNYRIFIYKYLMVYKVFTSYPVSVGDVMKFESDIVDTDLVVNKVRTFGLWKFIYMYTEFNQNIITDLLSTTGNITLTNLNKYSTVAQLKDRFNTHPISNAYKLDYLDSFGNVTTATSSVFQLSARFNTLTSYYNLQTSINVSANTQIVPATSTYQFSGGVSYSTVTTGTTSFFLGGISASNTITPIAGSGVPGLLDGVPAISGRLDGPIGISYDMFGNLYIADNENFRIRRVDANTNIINTIAGNSLTPGVYSGDAGPAVTAGLEGPTDVTVDMNGNIYIVGGTGSTNQVIRKIDALTGKIDVYAGSTLAPLYGAPGYNSAGENAPIFDTSVQFNNITGIHFSMNGIPGGSFGGPCLYVADCDNHLVRQIDINSGIIRTVAGDMTLTPGYSGDGGSATSAQLTNPYSVTTDLLGNLYIADSGNFVVRKVDFSTGDISTVAGNGVNGYIGDGGYATASSLGTVNGITIDSASNLHISSNDGVNKTIRVVDNFGKISTLTVLPNPALKLATNPFIPAVFFSTKDLNIVQRHPLPETKAIVSGTLLFLPNNGDTVVLTLNGTSTTFTFKNTPSLSQDIQISSTISGCVTNLVYGITSSTPYSTYLLYAEITSGDTLVLTMASNYGSIPNNNSNWNISFFDTTLAGTLANLLLGITSSYPNYLSPTSSSISGGDTVNLLVKSGYGSNPNANSNWQLTYNLTTGSSYQTNFYDMIYTTSFLKFGYSPTYNLLDYLTNINNVNDVNPKFYATKEYLAMPQYEGLPLGSLTASNVYIDYNGMTASFDLNSQGNKITFGSSLKLEWESIFVNTFVDVIIHGTSDYTTERLLVMDKYYDILNDAYVIEFHKRLNFNLGDAVIGNGGTLDIISRRKLSQISDDLQELNNIQKTKGKSNSWKDQGQYTYDTYENELNFKIPTDSYTKVLLSDSDTIQALSAIIYIDYKNELAMNITRLSKEYNVPIINTLNFTNKLYISCSEKHDLITGEGVVLEFTGGDGSSQQLNPQYSGYHVITKVNEYDFVTDIDYGQVPTVGIDSGFVKYTKQDPFLNYEPVDLIDLGVDGKGKIALELSIENLTLSDSVYSLIDVDFEKYRFRLIDGLNIETVNLQYSWLLEAELSGALIGLNANELVWYKGTWIFGRWFGGTWQSGVWMSGDWYGGTWNSNIVTDKKLTAEVDTKTVDFEQSFWYTGRWFDGIWNGGIWYGGRWYGGIWNNGMWHKGTWNDGTWNDGRFEGGIWVLGTWNNGIFNCDNEPAYWLDGKWHGGDFENGMWYNGYWEQRNTSSRFGTKSFNSRTANWQAGIWVSGSFYSFINVNDQGILDVSDVHKYSIWKTGQWLSGEWYGGIAYNMDFKTGTWYGGILEDIQVIGVDIVNNTFTLNGIFKFNTGDTIYIIDNQIGNANSVYGSNLNPGSYKVLYQTEDTINKRTVLYVASNLNGPAITPAVDTGLRVVSKFKNLNWKSGIWTNGIYETGLWEGGIWYNGVFSGIWS